MSSTEQERLEDQFLYAAEHGYLDRVKDCVSRGVNVEAQDRHSYRAIHHACENEYFNIVMYLIEECHVDATALIEDGRTALHEAASRCSGLPIVQYLIED